MKNKNPVECFGFFLVLVFFIHDMKDDKNIACTFFVNANTALNLNSYEEN